jgi:hypothetical protein
VKIGVVIALDLFVTNHNEQVLLRAGFLSNAQLQAAKQPRKNSTKSAFTTRILCLVGTDPAGLHYPGVTLI